MSKRVIPLFALVLAVLAAPLFPVRAESPPKKVLVVVEGATSLKNYAIGDGRQLAALLGHFSVQAKVLGVREYMRGEISHHDIVFYIGFHRKNPVPEQFTDDVLATDKPVVWMNTGFREFSALPSVRRRFGFAVTRLDTTSGFSAVRMGGTLTGKGEPNLNIIEISDRKRVEVLATALAPKAGRELPYIVRSGNLLYIGDSPFASAGESDRYILFADMLHDILQEPHEQSHSAILRIEDINPMDDPDKLREIADLLSAREIPFLVGVSPFYVNPGEGLRVSLSDKPELADALRYMVQNGGTIVMHGVTHQYKGVTGSDYEFWDESTNGPIKDETVEGISRKLDMGIQEFMRNGLYPLIWETPHYTASFRLYQTVSKYFSTAMEQRLAIEDADYTQFFPYVIHRDLFGQTIYPENLGYVPLDPDKDKSRGYVQAIIAGARAGLVVRDGFASCFFHSFLDLDLLKELVDGVRGLGYDYIDLRDVSHWARTNDRIMLTGNQEYTVTLNDQFLSETWFERNGDIARNVISEDRITGPVTRQVQLEPGAFYKAEPAEFRERKETVVQSIADGAQRILHNVLGREEQWKEAHPVLLWNHHARGATYNDQASFAAVLRSINLAVDTVFIGQGLDLSAYNLLIVPFGVVDSLRPQDFDAVTRFVQTGGNLITDGRNDLVENFGVTFGSGRVRVNRVRDRLFPDERIRWKNFDLLNKFDTKDVDKVFAIDEMTESPLVIGKKWEKGRVLFFGTLFDPYSQIGISRYPYLLEYIRSYFLLGPVVRRENLEVYFDPGYRRTISTEALVKQWVHQGIRIIHAAGWHQYPKYTYDYERLIRLAHANGILVYAWLEPPQVNQKFWTMHPEWREKNYRGQDASASWRFPVALTDKQCLAAMTMEYRTLLERYDWDGVNLAELYFEAGKGFQDPQRFTPMHPSARQEFMSLYGFDLQEVFDPQSEHFWNGHPTVVRDVTEYRVRKIREVYQVLLGMIGQVAEKKAGFDVIVTAMDSFGSPELREYIAVDMHNILDLQRKYGFLLQVEDPEHLWSTDPRRYVEIGARYAALTGDRSKILLDLNIVNARKPDAVTPFPTLIQTGTESFHLVRSAALGAPRLTIYAESSINPQDMIFMPYALAGEVEYRWKGDGYSLAAPYSVTMKLPPEIKQIQVDGRPLSSSRENLYLIPAGRHEISLAVDPAGAFSTHTLDTHILSMTGTILSVVYGMRSLDVDYESRTRTLMALNREPTRVTVDGRATDFTVMKGNDCYSVFLPAGRHRVEITAGDLFSYGVNLTSLWSTTAIAMFGLSAVLLLLAMYLVLKVIRRRVLPAGEQL
jgi:uncharacterized protein YdaL